MFNFNVHVDRIWLHCSGSFRIVPDFSTSLHYCLIRISQLKRSSCHSCLPHGGVHPDIEQPTSGRPACAQQAHDAITTVLRQNDVARHFDVIMMLLLRHVPAGCSILMPRGSWKIPPWTLTLTCAGRSKLTRASASGLGCFMCEIV